MRAPEEAELLFREIGSQDREALARFLEENDVPAITRTFTPFPLTAATAEPPESVRRIDSMRHVYHTHYNQPDPCRSAHKSG